MSNHLCFCCLFLVQRSAEHMYLLSDALINAAFDEVPLSLSVILSPLLLCAGLTDAKQMCLGKSLSVHGNHFVLMIFIMSSVFVMITSRVELMHQYVWGGPPHKNSIGHLLDLLYLTKTSFDDENNDYCHSAIQNVLLCVQTE